MHDRKLLFEKSVEGRRAVRLPNNPLTAQYQPDPGLLRKDPPRLPELAEVDLVRHYTSLSRMAYGVDTGFYPLGSCTMKYNPKINEAVAGLPGFSDVHPLQPEETVQGCLEVMWRLQRALCEIAGMDETTLLPAAGAHGEWTGLQLIRAYHAARGDHRRNKVLVPDSAHGTNPASAAMCGFKVVNIPSDTAGLVDMDSLETVVDDTVAALMLTNPNTLGKFEKNICRIQQIIHEAGGLLYYDGANLNAIMGVARPGDMGFDVVHWNVHKTLATPHGGGGPGSGPVGCKDFLKQYLPIPLVEKQGDRYTLRADMPESIGRIKAFYGNFLVALKGYCTILALGGAGLKQASMHAVLNANYMLHALREYSDLTYDSPCMHEFVLSMETLKRETGVSALDMAKTLIDYGVHPPTMYFPLIVHEALMFEPTETESRETMDAAIAAIKEIFAKAWETPEALRQSPVTTPVGRLDEVAAARNPRLRWEF